MKNPVFFANKTKPQIIHIYQYQGDTFLKLATLQENETTILNIPKNSYIIVTAIQQNDNSKYEHTLFESNLEKYHNHFRF